jgi:hypothetical protein
VQPKELTLIDTVVQKGWIEGVNDIENVFDVLPLPCSFAKGLERDIDNNEVVHLAVTAAASSVKSIVRGTIWRTSFQRFDVCYVTLRHLRIYSTSL